MKYATPSEYWTCGNAGFDLRRQLEKLGGAVEAVPLGVNDAEIQVRAREHSAHRRGDRGPLLWRQLLEAADFERQREAYGVCIRSVREIVGKLAAIGFGALGRQPLRFGELALRFLGCAGLPERRAELIVNQPAARLPHPAVGRRSARAARVERAPEGDDRLGRTSERQLASPQVEPGIRRRRGNGSGLLEKRQRFRVAPRLDERHPEPQRRGWIVRDDSQFLAELGDRFVHLDDAFLHHRGGSEVVVSARGLRIHLQGAAKRAACRLEESEIAIGAADEDVGLRRRPGGGDLGEQPLGSLHVLDAKVPGGEREGQLRILGIHRVGIFELLHRLFGSARRDQRLRERDAHRNAARRRLGEAAKDGERGLRITQLHLHERQRLHGGRVVHDGFRRAFECMTRIREPAVAHVQLAEDQPALQQCCPVAAFRHFQLAAAQPLFGCRGHSFQAEQQLVFLRGERSRAGRDREHASQQEASEGHARNSIARRQASCGPSRYRPHTATGARCRQRTEDRAARRHPGRA